MSQQKQYYLCPDSEITEQAMAHVFRDTGVMFEKCDLICEDKSPRVMWRMTDYATANSIRNIFTGKGFVCEIYYSQFWSPPTLLIGMRTRPPVKRIMTKNVLVDRRATQLRRN